CTRGPLIQWVQFDFW
nr:immunoglobulin heavy chain junction region [Macaca mulatta]MOV54979.1 immunoglobulin heavy chain junction region [Macaca mulatta]MOV55068.1 immunoglobulin heavy chain junction region [Macaca mulatta]MOV56299.1 immunoglobulin heavy chain junction region [Macaca mulatta]MOV56412.1 immunoglobulin heavy chain junction region [Macaca mulatta]